MGAAGPHKSSDSVEDSKETTEDFSSHFGNTVLLVRDYSSWLEQDYARPIMKTGRIFYDQRPIAATFYVIFSILSFGPIISFLGVSIFIITSFTLLALGGALLAASAIILGLFLILASVLIVILFTTGILTSFVVFSYLFFRLATLVHQEGRSGIYNWAGETKHHFVFWGPNGNRVSASTTGKDSVEPSFQSQADRQEHKNHSVGNSSDILDDSR